MAVLPAAGFTASPAAGSVAPDPPQEEDGEEFAAHGDPSPAEGDATPLLRWPWETTGFLFWPHPVPVEGPLSTDRPGFADTTAALPRGHVQLELGYTFTENREDGIQTRDHAIGQTNLRLGLLDNLELRTLWSGFSATEIRSTRGVSSTDHEDGAGDVTFGLRTEVLQNEGVVPDLTLLTDLLVPVGSENKSADDLVPDLRLAYGWLLTESLRLYGVGIAAAASGDDGRFFQGSASAGLSYPLTDRLGTFVEYFGIYSSGNGDAPSHNLDGGFTFLLRDDLQVDLSAGVGLNEQAPDVFVGAGLSFRW
jgi:hypothetical protein